MMKNTRSLLLFLFLVFACSLQAITWEDSDSGFLENDALRSLSQKATRENYPDADTILLDQQMQIQYNADGTFVQVADTATKVMTQAGVDAERVLASYYSKNYARAKISLVQLLKENGETITVDLAKYTQEKIDDSQMNSNIYDPNSMVINVSVPDLQPGDILRAVYVDENLKPRVPNSFSDAYVFEGEHPILHTLVTVSAPRDLPLKSIVVKDPQQGGPAFTKKGDGKRILYTWEVHDVPRIFNEPASPRLYAYLQRVLVSTFSSWEEVSRWYHDLCEPRLAIDDDIRNAVASLTAECKNDEERMIALYNFVSQRVRYMGLTLEDTAPGYEPHDVTRTFAQRAGVCRDMAALLAAMFRAAGYEANPTLINVGPRKDVEVPQPWFNHAITAVRLPGADTWRLMDPTNTNTREPFPAYLSDKSYLVATAQGDPLRLSPVTPYTENQIRISTAGKLTPSGDLLFTTRLVFTGLSDNAYRNFFLAITPEEQRNFFEKQLSAAIPGAKLERLRILPQDLQDLTAPLQAEIACNAPRYLITALDDDGRPDLSPGKTGMFRFPRFSGLFGMNLMVFGNATLEKRRFPLEASSTNSVSEEITLAFPHEFQPVSLPEYSQTDNELFAFTRRLDSGVDCLKLNSLYASKTMRYSPEEYLLLKKALAQKDAEDRKMVLFRFAKPEEEQAPEAFPEERPDLECLLNETKIVLTSENNWTTETKTRLLVKTYAGIDAADCSYYFNPAWETLEVLDATVTNGENTTATPPENINIMDADWVASAPRYPAGKRLVISLPGVDIGSIVEIRTRSTVSGQPFFFHVEPLRGPIPIHQWSLEVEASKDLKMAREYFPNGWLDLAGDLKEPIDVDYSLTKNLPNGMLRHAYRAKDIPARHRESSCPPSYAYLPTVVFSTGNWKNYASLLQNHADSLDMDGETIRAVTAPLLELPEEERVTKIRDWIEKNIRRDGPAFTELPLSCLTAPETTAKDRYGNSADTALLYKAMLKAAGIPCQLFLASSITQLKDLQFFFRKFPVGNYFEDWLVKAEAGGKEIWLNDQTQYAQLGTCAYDHGLLLGLSKGDLRILSLPKEFQDNPTAKWTLNVNADGSAILTIRESIQGTAFGNVRRFFERLTPEERRRHYQQVVSGISQDATAVTPDMTTDFQNYPGTSSYTVKLAHCATFDGDFCYLKLPVDLSKALKYAAGERHYHPLCHGGFQTDHLTLDVSLPEGYPNIILAPKDFRWHSPDGGGSLSWVCQDLNRSDKKRRTLRFLYTVELTPAIASVGLFPEFQEAFRRLAHSDATTILLSR